MSIKFKCNSCGKSLSATIQMVGRSARCPSCQNTNEVPEPSNEYQPASVAMAQTPPLTAPPIASSTARPITSSVYSSRSPNINRRCHEIDYQIVGDDMQMVIVELDPGETVIAEAGAMNFMEEGINFETKMGDGSEPDKGFFRQSAQRGQTSHHW